jgi:hypothetical protein
MTRNHDPCAGEHTCAEMIELEAENWRLLGEVEKKTVAHMSMSREVEFSRAEKVENRAENIKIKEENRLMKEKLEDELALVRSLNGVALDQRSELMEENSALRALARTERALELLDENNRLHNALDEALDWIIAWTEPGSIVERIRAIAKG